jgi:catechol 2,3-dioxygenase-like lactoylglutathione lyase family enzyme
MSHIRRFDHVGITVADLDRATAFFVGLDLEVEGKMYMEGEFVDTVGGIGQYRTSGAWPTCAARRGSSCLWLSGSADVQRAAPSGGQSVATT